MLVRYLVGHAGPTKSIAPGTVVDEPEGLAMRLIAAGEGEAVQHGPHGRLIPAMIVPPHPLESAPAEYRKEIVPDAAIVAPAENAAIRTKPVPAKRQTKKPEPPTELTGKIVAD